MFYTNGIYQSYNCNNGAGHEMLVVGYGSEGSSDYWVVQNSWGASWGEKGYARITRGNNACGIESCAVFPNEISDLEIEKNSEYELIYWDIEQTGARCIDGSPAGIAFAKGYGEGKDKTFIHFLGGAWCAGRDRDSVLNDCIARSKTDLGSSKNWNKINYFNALVPGTPEGNLNFYNWNRVIVQYCDGSGHQGYTKDPVV